MKPTVFAVASYQCGTCGNPVRIELLPSCVDFPTMTHIQGTCYGQTCAFNGVTIRIPVTRVECDVLEETPRAPAAKLPHTDSL